MQPPPDEEYPVGSSTANIVVTNRKRGMMRSWVCNVYYQGKVFKTDSHGEARRLVELLQYHVEGIITLIDTQFKVGLKSWHEGLQDYSHDCEYRADFLYSHNGQVYMEDYKSIASIEHESFQRKCKMVREQYPNMPLLIRTKANPKTFDGMPPPAYQTDYTART